MLKVKTKVLPSKIEGLGLFADQFIPKGTVIWEYDPAFDERIHKEVLNNVPEAYKDFFTTYAYREGDEYILCVDNARFINHSIDANVIDTIKTKTIAARDIAAGEEITSDYSSFDDDSKSKPSNELY